MLLIKILFIAVLVILIGLLVLFIGAGMNEKKFKEGDEYE